MSGMSDFTEAAVLNAICNNSSFAVAQVYVSLHTADPGDASGANELTDSGYARKASSFGAAVSPGGTCANDAEVLGNAIADAGPFSVSHFGIWDAVSGGNYLGSAALATTKVFSQGDVPRFPVGALVLTAS